MAFKIGKSKYNSDEGVWTEFEGGKFKIAYAANPKFARFKQKLEQPHRRKIENGTIDPVEHRAILTKCVAHAILIDWQEIVDEFNQSVPYSVDKAEELLLADEGLREFVMEFSTQLLNFKQDEKDEDVKY